MLFVPGQAESPPEDILFTFKETKYESIFQPSKVLRVSVERIIININEISKLGEQVSSPWGWSKAGCIQRG